MTIQEFKQMLLESGVDSATVDAIVANEKVSARATSLRQGSEYDTLNTRATQLEREAAQAKNYQVWYEKNYPAVLKLQQDAARYVERYGSLDDATPPGRQPVQMDEAAMRTLITNQMAEQFQKQYAPQVVATMTGIGAVVEKHMRRGRKENIDWKKLDELAAKTNGNIDAAYDEYDKANVDADRESDIQKRIDAGVKEKLAAAGVNRFPAGADAHPTSRSPRSKDDGPKAYDRSKLLDTFVSGNYSGFTQ